MDSHAFHSFASLLLGLFYPLAMGWVVKQHNDAVKSITGIHNESVKTVAQAGLAVATSLAAAGAAKAGTWTESHGIAPADATSSLISALATGQAAPSGLNVTPVGASPAPVVSGSAAGATGVSP